MNKFFFKLWTFLHMQSNRLPKRLIIYTVTSNGIAFLPNISINVNFKNCYWKRLKLMPKGGGRVTCKF